jgi:hypothetical protein
LDSGWIELSHATHDLDHDLAYLTILLLGICFI